MGFSETFFERIKKGIGKMKENISRELTDTRKKTAGIYEKAESEILKSVSETGKDMLDDTVKNQKDIVSAQSLYASEKVRIEKKRKEQSEALARAEYEEKLASAKDSAKAAKLIREENFRLEKSADEEYLEQLKSAAEKEKQVRSEEFSALKNSLDLGYITQSEYYSRLAGLRDKYFEEDSDEWVKYT
ncbi:MAG: hypothetical protein J1F64_11455, partial [Oscillospiraceae bacterium]|nr:hypothetical protein [Oscillospiraceae bacterium]